MYAPELISSGITAFLHDLNPTYCSDAKEGPNIAGC